MRLIAPVPNEQLELCYKLRYQAYCIDYPFEPKNEMGLEMDDHDNQSIHVMVLNDKDIPLGCARLVLYPYHVGEISRFCIDPNYPNRLSTRIALIQGLVKISEETETHIWFAVMEPRFMKSLGKNGIEYTEVGPTMSFRGERQSYIIRIPDKPPFK